MCHPAHLKRVIQGRSLHCLAQPPKNIHFPSQLGHSVKKSLYVDTSDIARMEAPDSHRQMRMHRDPMKGTEGLRSQFL